MMECKFCKYSREETDSYIGVDFYLCESCLSIMCVSCMWTSIKSGRDYCVYCYQNLQWEGRQI